MTNVVKYVSGRIVTRLGFSFQSILRFKAGQDGVDSADEQRGGRRRRGGGRAGRARGGGGAGDPPLGRGAGQQLASRRRLQVPAAAAGAAPLLHLAQRLARRAH